MSRRATVLVLLAVLSVGGGTSTALAQSTSSVAPPGNSAVDQYRESVPPSSPDARRLTRRDREALEREGRDGRALISALERSGGVPRAAETAGDSARGGGTAEGRNGNARDGNRPSGTGSSESAGSGVRTSKTRGVDDARAGSVAPAAAASTVGPVPVWALLVAAVALVGVGLVLRTRSVW